MWLIPTSAQGGGSRGGGGSAVHRSRRAGAGVLTYFAGAGVCSPPVNLRQHLFVLQTIIVLQRKNFSPSTKNRQCFFLAGLPFLDKVIHNYYQFSCPSSNPAWIFARDPDLWISNGLLTV